MLPPPDTHLERPACVQSEHWHEYVEDICQQMMDQEGHENQIIEADDWSK